MATITWRNVNTPNFGASNNLALAGAQNVQRGIEGVAAGLQDYGAKDKLETEGNIKSFIDSFRNQDDYLAARDSGAFSDEALTKAYGGNFDSRVAQQYAKDREGAINREEQAAYDQGQKAFLRQKDTDAQAQYALDQTNKTNILAYQQDIAENMPKGLSVAAQNKWKIGRDSYNSLNRLQQEDEKLKQRNLIDTDYNNRETDYQRGEVAKQRKIAPVIGALNQAILESRGDAGKLENILNNVQDNPNKYIQDLAPKVANRLDSLNNAKNVKNTALNIQTIEQDALKKKKGRPVAEYVNVASADSLKGFADLKTQMKGAGDTGTRDVGPVVDEFRRTPYKSQGESFDYPPQVLKEAYDNLREQQWFPSTIDLENLPHRQEVAKVMSRYVESVYNGREHQADLDVIALKRKQLELSSK